MAPTALQRRSRARRRPTAAATVTAALLCVGVALIHVKDQGGVTALKHPAYLGLAFWTVEVAGLVAAVALALTAAKRVWLFAMAVGAGPLLGYVLTRGPGLPGALDDRGNWGEPLGVMSLAVEVVLVVISVVGFVRSREAAAHLVVRA